MSPAVSAATTAAITASNASTMATGPMPPNAGVVLTIFFAAFLFAIFAVAFSYAWFSR